jgi:hypothetical protein
MTMAELRTIPSHPWETVRERYRELAAQVRPGDPRTVPFEPRRLPVNLIRVSLQLAAGLIVLGLLWKLL